MNNLTLSSIQGREVSQDLTMNGRPPLKAGHHSNPASSNVVSKNFAVGDEMNFSVLRSVQGLHAPLRLMMERKLASKVGHLPILPSSNVMLETLEGRDETIDFEDLYNADPWDPVEYARTPSLTLDLLDKII